MAASTKERTAAPMNGVTGQDCSRSFGDVCRGSSSTEWVESVVVQCRQQTQLDAQEQLCERAQARDMVHGLRPHCGRGSADTEATCFNEVCNTVGRRKNLAKKCGATGSRRFRNSSQDP